MQHDMMDSLMSITADGRTQRATVPKPRVGDISITVILESTTIPSINRTVQSQRNSLEFLIKEASPWQKCLHQWPFGGGRPRESWHTHFRMKESKPLDVRSFEERGFKSMGSCHVVKAGIISSRKKALKITVQLSRWLAPIGCFVRHVHGMSTAYLMTNTTIGYTRGGAV